MEDAKKRPRPSLPANYVSFLDLRERWMKQQQKKKQDEEIEGKELQGNSEIQDDEEQVKPECENKDDGDDNQLEDRQPDEISVVQSNPNPYIAIRRPSYDKRRHRKEGNKRWVPLKQAPAVTIFRPKQAPPPIQASKLEPAPVVLVKPKALPVYLADQSKPLPLDVPKVETAVQAPAEIRGSDKEVTDRKINSVTMRKAKLRNQKRDLREDLLQSQPNKGVSATKGDLEEKADAKVLEEPKATPALHAYQLKPLPSEAAIFGTAIQVPGEIRGSDKEIKDWKPINGKAKKANTRVWKRNQKKYLVPSQSNAGILAPNFDVEEKANARVQLEPKAVPELHFDQSKPPPLEATKVDLAVQPQIQSSDDMFNDRKLDREKKTKQFKKNWKRYKKVENVVQPQLKNGILAPNGDVEEKENPEQEVEAESENKDVGDNSRAETEGKFAGLSLTRAPEESCSRGSIGARNRPGWRKDVSYGKFQLRVMLKKERWGKEGSLVWVKKGEFSQTGDVAVENAGIIRV